jgi:nanoRNase/pAp phosphatase (c-di-AMP/oligoRNAs hydrolase)
VALVDTQPGAGNNALPEHCDLVIVLDHHPLREATARAAFCDVRADVGATSTMLTEYLRRADLAFPPWLATALFYGIKTDTMGLSRGAREADADAYFYLQPLVDIDALVSIERAQVPAQYFQSLVATLQATRVYDALAISYLGWMSYPSLAAEMADLLLRLKGVKWAICMGAHGQELIVSVRTTQRGGADRLVQEIVRDRGSAGGHGSMAGGQVPLGQQDPASLAQELEWIARAHLRIPADLPGMPLV